MSARQIQTGIRVAKALREVSEEQESQQQASCLHGLFAYIVKKATDDALVHKVLCECAVCWCWYVLYI